MKTIKIFLSASSELENDISALASFVRQLNIKVYEKRDICLQLLQWEDFETDSYSGNRYQDAYNDLIADCDIFIVLFHKTAGAFAIAEYDNAVESFRKIGLPKVYTYFKTLKEGDIESESLRIFKERLLDLGCYPTYYHNIDALQLHFVMQLQLFESTELKVEDGKVVLDGMPIALMENLPFAGQNEDFQRLSTRLAELPAKIEKARAKTEKYPDDEDFIDDLQALLNEYNKLKDEFAEYQYNLFTTAKRIAQLQGESITDRMRRAMEAFNEGNVLKANIILDEALINAYDLLSTLEASRKEVEESIEEIKFKIQCIQYDSSLSQDEQFTRVDSLYTKVIELSKEIDYDTDKFDKLLFDYAQFLYDNCYYEKAKEYFIQELEIRTTLLGVEHPDTATSYNSIGLVYYHLGEYDNALECYCKALVTQEKELGIEHPDTATSYNSIGLVYAHLGEYDKGLEYIYKALAIREKNLGIEHPDTAMSYFAIGEVRFLLGDYTKALDYHKESLSIREKTLGLEHIDTSISYENVGRINYQLAEYGEALNCYSKALCIRENLLGPQHPLLVSIYSNIGSVYYAIGEYSKALEFDREALKGCRITYGNKHVKTALFNEYLGNVFLSIADYENALDRYQEAMSIRMDLLGEKHPDVIRLYSQLGNIYVIINRIDEAKECYEKVLHLNDNDSVNGESITTAYAYEGVGCSYLAKGDYNNALEFYLKALAICENLLGSEHPIIATSYNKIGDVYKRLGCYDNALEYHIKALEISKKVLGLEDSSTATSYHNIGNVYSESGDYDKALEYYFRALDIQEKKLGIEHPETASSYGNIGEVYYKLKQYDKAQEYYLKALDVYEKKFGSSHPTTVSYKKSISLIYDLQGKTMEAKYYFETIKVGPEWNVYISTCIEDYEKAKQYATAISNCGFQPIISVDGSVNSDEYRVFISLATETFYKSKACFKEYDEAYNAGKKIAVLQLDKFQADPRLTNVIEDWTDVGDYKTLEEEMAKLLARKTNQNVATAEQRQRNADADFERYEPQKNDTNIFISYRRKDGRNFARIVELALKLRGYKNVFMDYTSLKDGYFNNQILDSIYSCDDFILITTDAACEAIKKSVSISEDWVAKEIRSAIRHNKHIIPLVIEEMFNNGWPKDEELSEDGKMVKSNQDRKLKDDEYFDDSIGKLEAFLHAKPSIVIDEKASYKVKVNKKAYLYIDDEKIQTLEANTLAKIPLEQGGYFRRIEDAEDATNFVEDAIEMYKDKAEFIKLN